MLTSQLVMQAAIVSLALLEHAYRIEKTSEQSLVTKTHLWIIVFQLLVIERRAFYPFLGNQIWRFSKTY